MLDSGVNTARLRGNRQEKTFKLFPFPQFRIKNAQSEQY